MAASAVTTVAVILVVAGVPVALVRWVGWALVTPPMTALVGLRYGTVSEDVLLTALTVIVWVAWAQLTVALVVEAAAAIRGRLSRRVAMAGVFQPVAARAVATLAVVAATLLTRPPTAIAEPSTCAAVAPAAVDPDGPSRPADGTARVPVYRVRRHDTLWGIAERRLGDGRRWREIHSLNVGRRQPDGGALGADGDVLQVGWRLRLPTDDPSDDPVPADAVTVTAGDTLSGLAAEHLGDARRWPRLYAATVGRPQPDGRTLSNPDLLLPGWKIAGARHTPTRARRGNHPPADQRDRPTPPATTDVGKRRDDPGPSEAPSHAAAPTPRSSPGPTEPRPGAPSAPLDDVDRDPARDGTGGWTSWLVASGVATVIAGWLVAWRRVWLRRRRAGDRRTALAEHSADHSRAPGVAGVHTRERAAAAVAWLIDEAVRLDVWLPRVAGVTIDAAGVVTVLLVDNAPEHLPAGWERDRSDPRQARLPASVAMPDGRGQPSPGRMVAATLMTLGTGVRSGQQLLLALATCRHLVVSGSDDVVVESMLAWALELVSDPHGIVDVWLVGFALPKPSTPSGDSARLHVVKTVTEAVDRLRDAAVTERDESVERGECRAVVVCAPDVAEDDVRRVHRLVRADGLAVAAVTAFDDGSGWTVRVSSDEVTVTSLRQGVALQAHCRVTPTAFADAARQVTVARADAVATQADPPTPPAPSEAMDESPWV